MSDFYVAPMMKENPFYYDGIKQDEYLTEMVYYSEFVSDTERRVKEKYKPLMKQLQDGDIKKIPDKYKYLCIDPNWDKDL